MSNQQDLGFAKPWANEGPVECLGMTFEHDDARRAHFLGLLQKKLQDPEFRKISGFPKGSDEAILRLSDPPYYTACPNPFLEDFVKQCSSSEQQEPYEREPFAIDVSEGKTDPVYKAHSYHTKVPYSAIVPSILHYTEPGDLVLDAFCGSGQTGVAASMCGVADQELKASVQAALGGNAKWGTRRCILLDLSPSATFIAHNYNHPPDPETFASAFESQLDRIESETSHFYDVAGGERFHYAVWTDCFSCPECGREFSFWDAAVDLKSGSVSTDFCCPHCDTEVSKNGLERVIERFYDRALGVVVPRGKYVLSMINVGTGRDRRLRSPTEAEVELALTFEGFAQADWFPVDKMMFKDGAWGDMYRAGYHTGISHVHHFFTSRNLHALARARKVIEELPLGLRSAGRYVFTGTVQIASRMSRFRFDSRNPQNTAGGIMNGVLFVPSMTKEARLSDLMSRRFEAIKQQHAIQHDWPGKRATAIGTASATRIDLPDACVDYVFIDPPFGKNIMYSELSFLWEAWLQVFTNNEEEAIVSDFQAKGLLEYQRLMQASFAELYRVLKPGRWCTVVFSNSLNSVWRAIQEALGAAGFVVADTRTLDKKQRSFKQVTSSAVKQDLVISAYKPTEALTHRFELGHTTAEGAWAFVKEHLGNVPVFVGRASDGEVVAARTAQMLLDRMIAFHVQRGISVPLSGPEFLQGLAQRFPERDGMYFLPDQVAEYDRKRTSVSELRQLSLFVNDEASAIQWVRQQLQDKPQSFQDLTPQYMREVHAWAKHEETVELKTILEQSFLHYDGRGPVPSQIHRYLSTNYKDLRNLDKEDPRLVEKARDRWYVPDPNKQAEREAIREKALLREFEDYKSSTQRKLNVFRTEAVRAGFKACWQERDYGTIVKVAEKLPDAVLQEDEKLLMYYDNALTRLGD